MLTGIFLAVYLSVGILVWVVVAARADGPRLVLAAMSPFAAVPVVAALAGTRVVLGVLFAGLAALLAEVLDGGEGPWWSLVRTVVLWPVVVAMAVVERVTTWSLAGSRGRGRRPVVPTARVVSRGRR